MFVPVQYSALVLYTRSQILRKQSAAGLFNQPDMKQKSKAGRKPKFTEPSKRLSKRVPISQHERLDQLLETEIEPFKVKR